MSFENLFQFFSFLRVHFINKNDGIRKGSNPVLATPGNALKIEERKRAKRSQKKDVPRELESRIEIP
jgi:hypothetical protein